MNDSSEGRKGQSRTGFESKERERFLKLEPLDVVIDPAKKEGRIEIIEKIQDMCSKLENSFDPASSQSNIEKKTQQKNSSNDLRKKFTYKFGVSIHPKINYIVSELKKRMKSLPSKSDLRISPNRFNKHQENSEKIGPGRYLNKGTQEIEGHKFSLIPRLTTPISHNLFRIESQYPNKKNISTEKIRYNKLLADDFDEYQNIKKQRISAENIKTFKTKNKKRCIDEQKHEELLQKLKKKLQLFEWRMAKDEVQRVKKSWTLLYFVAGFSMVALVRSKIKKLLRSRWEIFLRKFVVISKFVAKFLIRLKQIRKAIIEKRLRKISEPFKEYLKQALLQKKKLIQIYIDEYYKLPEISKLMVKVKFSVIRLQRHSKRFLKIQEARMQALRFFWDKLYFLHIRKKPEKFAEFERLGSISKEVIDYHLHKFLTKSLRLYISERKIYNLNPGTIPFKPRLKLYTKPDRLLRSIEYALKIKQRILRQQKLKKYRQNLLSINSKSP